MRTIPSLILGAILLPAVVLAGDVPRLIDADGPAEGTKPLQLNELWRAGGEDEGVIFGRIVDIRGDAAGNIYVMDNQLCQASVFSPDGELLRTMSRQGDGPGEVRQPIGLVILGEDLVGIGAGFPAKLVTLRKDGTPVDTRWPAGRPIDGNIGVMTTIQFRDGVLAATGGRIVFDPANGSYTRRFLAVTDASCAETRDILEKQTPIDPTGREFSEADNDFIERNWALGPDGVIFAAMSRDKYEVSVYDRTGELLRVFGREYEGRKRTQAEKDAITPLINVNAATDRSEWQIEDRDPCISRILFNGDDGTVWVLGSQGADDQADGVLETWDVFSPEGEYLREVPLQVDEPMDEATIFLLGDGRLVVSRGTGSSFSGAEPADEDEAEIEPLEIICYAAR